MPGNGKATSRRALLSGTVDVLRFPEDPLATGISRNLDDDKMSVGDQRQHSETIDPLVADDDVADDFFFCVLLSLCGLLLVDPYLHILQGQICPA